MAWLTIFLLTVITVETVVGAFLLWVIGVQNYAIQGQKKTIEELLGAGVVTESQVAGHLLEHAKRYRKSNPIVYEALQHEAMRVTGLTTKAR